MKISIPQKFRRLTKILIWSVTFILLLQVAYFIFSYYETKRIEKKLAEQVEVIKPEPVMLFNIAIDSFTVVPGQVKSGQNLSDLLVTQGPGLMKFQKNLRRFLMSGK